MRLNEVEDLLAASMSGPVNNSVVFMVTADSRRVIPGTLFVAVRGHDGDGHDFIDQALKRGCIGVVGEVKPDGFSGEIPFFRVDDSRYGLGLLAVEFYGNPADKLTLIGLTGTNGKTTTSWIIEAILQQARLQTGVIGTVNYRYQGEDGKMIVRPARLTTPDPLKLQSLLKEMAEAGVTHVIIEASSHALHQRRLAGLLFSVVLFTNLSRDHLDYHRSMDDYFAAKKLLFTDYLQKNGISVVVAQPESRNDYGSRLIEELAGQKVIRVGLDKADQVFADNLELGIDGSFFTLKIPEKTVSEQVCSSLVGRHNVLNEIGAAGVAFALGIDAAHIRDGLNKLKDVPGRLERIFPAGESVEMALPAVFVDYAHTPDALENVLTTLKALVSGRLICVFGCGGDRDRGKRPLMGEVAARLADIVVLTSDNPRGEVPEEIIAETMPGIEQAGMVKKTVNELFCSDSDPDRAERGYMTETDRRTAIHLACVGSSEGDTVLIAGKGHEDYQLKGKDKEFFSDNLEVQDGFAAWTVDKLVKATGGELLAGISTSIIIFSGISTDTRSLQAGDVFVALRGDKYDGHDFIDDAVAKGAEVVVVEEAPLELKHKVLVIQVDDTLKALGDLAGFRRKLLADNLKVIGITGSSGKTTLKEMVAAILAEFHASETYNGPSRSLILKTEGNFNNLIGLPISLLPLSAEHQVAVMEMGMSAFGEIGRMAEIADPDIACINNVQAAHLEGVGGSLEGVAQAKGELFAGLRPDALRIVNYDDFRVVKLAKKYSGPEIGFAVTAKGRKKKPLVRVTRVTSLGEKGSRFTLHIGDWQQRITILVPGIHNVHNAAAAAAISHGYGVDKDAIIQGLVHYVSVNKRMQFIEMPGGLLVLDDSYNANPSSMEAALRTVSSFGDENCRRVAALGDMLELGDEAEDRHKEVGRLLATLGYDMIAVTGEYSEQYLAGAREAGMSNDKMMRFVETITMADWLYHLLIAGRLGEGDWLLVKGSRGMRMEKLLVELQNRFDPAMNGRNL